jgi:hypothetical protein
MKPTSIVFLLGAQLCALLCACSEPIPDRNGAPEAAFLAARAALRDHDLPAYFDALTDAAVRTTLKGSISVCATGTQPGARAAGLVASTGCEAILARHHWPQDAEKSPERFKSAIAAIAQPRALATEMEANNRQYGAATSFVWGYLNGVQLSEWVISGNYATALAQWDTGEKRPMHFEKDASGWRVNPLPGQK